MSGVRLDTRVHIITGANTALQNIQNVSIVAVLQMDQIMLQPLASGQAVLTEDERFGRMRHRHRRRLTDIAVYTNGAIPYCRDSRGGRFDYQRFGTSTAHPAQSAAEYIKIHYGVAIPDMDGLDEMVEVPSVGDR